MYTTQCRSILYPLSLSSCIGGCCKIVNLLECRVALKERRGNISSTENEELHRAPVLCVYESHLNPVKASIQGTLQLSSKLNGYLQRWIVWDGCLCPTRWSVPGDYDWTENRWFGNQVVRTHCGMFFCWNQDQDDHKPQGCLSNNFSYFPLCFTS